MKQDQPIECHVQGYGVQQGSAQIAFYSKQQRIFYAARIILILLAAATITLFIPVVHLIAVPLLLIAAPVAAWVIYRRTALRLGGTGKCPSCNAELIIMSGSVEWPFFQTCSSCGSTIRMEKGKE